MDKEDVAHIYNGILLSHKIKIFKKEVSSPQGSTVSHLTHGRFGPLAGSRTGGLLGLAFLSLVKLRLLVHLGHRR